MILSSSSRKPIPKNRKIIGLILIIPRLKPSKKKSLHKGIRRRLR
jgi:hypothetical protein